MSPLAHFSLFVCLLLPFLRCKRYFIFLCVEGILRRRSIEVVLQSFSRKAEQTTLIDKPVTSVFSPEVPLTTRVSNPIEDSAPMIQPTPTLMENTLQTEPDLFDDEEDFGRPVVKKGRRSHGKRVNELFID